jgi:ATP synthase protein I
MSDKPDSQLPKTVSAFSDQIGTKVARKLQARRDSGTDIWSGLGMMGMVGWSVAVPTLLGATLGIWLDKHYPGDRWWTLALLVAGLAAGCLIAWRGVAKEEKAMKEGEGADDE